MRPALMLVIATITSALLGGCSVVSTTANVAMTAVNVGVTAVNVGTTAAGMAWDTGKATVAGVTTVGGWAVDAAKSSPAPAATVVHTSTVTATEPSEVVVTPLQQ